MLAAIATLASTLGAIAPASSSWAQSGNLSDVTGPIVTTSDLIQPSLQTEGNNIEGGSIVTSYAYACPAAGNYVNDRLQGAIAQLDSGTLATPSTGLPPTVSTTTYQIAQGNIAALEQIDSLSSDEIEAIATAQSAGDLQGVLIDSGLSAADAAQLTETLVLFRRAFGQIGLSAAETARALEAIATILDSESITAEQLQQATVTYNQVVNSASAAFLQNPAPELSVMQSLLEQLSTADIADLCGNSSGVSATAE